MHRRTVLLGASALGFCLAATPMAWAANPAEDFVATNIQAGFNILNDGGIAPAERRQRFADFLLGLTDVRRVAVFMLGRYAAGAAQSDLDGYIAAYQNYLVSTYQSYFQLYAGQSLKVVSSRERAAGDFIVTANVVGQSGAPLDVDFRVRTDGAKPVLVDIAVAGVWLALAQRDQFLATLAQNNGDIKALTGHLQALQAR